MTSTEADCDSPASLYQESARVLENNQPNTVRNSVTPSSSSYSTSTISSTATTSPIVGGSISSNSVATTVGRAITKNNQHLPQNYSRDFQVPSEPLFNQRQHSFGSNEGPPQAWVKPTHLQRQHSYHSLAAGAGGFSKQQRPQLQGYFHNSGVSKTQRFPVGFGRQPSLQHDPPSHYLSSGFQVFDQPVYTTSVTNSGGYEGPLIPPPGFPLRDISAVTNNSSTIADLSNQMLAASISAPMTSTNSVWSNTATNFNADGDYEDSDSEEDDLTHPNKFPSGVKVKQMKNTVYDPLAAQSRSETQHVKYYQKDLVRICRCGQYSQMEGALSHGRNNDCDGYEIHYSQKCKWKAYDDFKTGARVLIRLCKCYKPT
ncbi:hypothetical protein EB796_005141 [Bugula neritina]|uniref:Uncharacterized protein n=1 Tax=Bugula neritina TaxID=10212 RepID=A0A7J7KFA6_BUGNE|nr:hypothetical protein EB796_005141 [Bugula neritina]